MAITSNRITKSAWIYYASWSPIYVGLTIEMMYAGNLVIALNALSGSPQPTTEFLKSETG